MNGKKIVCVILSAALVAGAAFAGGTKEAASSKPVTLNLGHGAATTNPRHIVALQFAEYVKAQTNGRITIAIHPSESLGSDRQMAEKVALGTLDMSINSQGPIAGYNQKLLMVGMPFLFATPKQAYAVLDGEIGEQISKELVPSGFHVLAYWENGFRHITNNARPINKPEDLKGLKIRTPEDKVTLAIFRALGASPAPLAFGELPMALSQGVFDGQENPVVNIHSAKLYEVQKFISLSNHKYETCPMIVSEATWGKLSAADQKILKDAALKYAAVHREMNGKLNNDLLSDLEAKGMKKNQADVAALREATKSVYAEFEPTFGKDFVAKVLDVVSKN
ncbi:MAG: DctP family TRAP transporter solute-binding subunit [Treponemataceae bacterium]